GCILRVGSRTARVEGLIKTSGLRPVAIFKKGHARVPGGSSVCRSSGFNVEVSRADGVIEKQVQDTIRFLKRHARGLTRLRRCRAFGGMTLDFGLYDRATADRPSPSYRLSRALVALAGRLGIEIHLSFYGRGALEP